MKRENGSTTPVVESYIDDIAGAIDTLKPATAADVRGNVEIDASFASNAFLKDLRETPAYANQFTDVALLERIGSQAIIPMASEPEKVVRAASLPVESKPNEIERTSSSEGPRRSLGARALASVRGFGKKFQSTYYSGVASAVTAFPGTKSKQELLDLSSEQKEKYAAKADDGLFIRNWNKLRRNKYEMMSWTPVMALGSLAVGGLMMRSIGYFHVVETIPTETHDWNNAIVVTPLPPVETHEITLPQASAVIDTPAPKPVPTYSKHVWEPAPDTVSVPSSTEKNMPYTGKEIVIVTGGATDPTGDLATQQLIDNGTIDPNKVTIIKNQYPAEMAPFVGQQSTQQSTAIGAQNIRDIIAQNPNAKITSYAFSEGNFPNDTVGAEQYRLGDKDVNFVGYGSGNAASGLLNSPLAEAFRPIVDGLGITRIPPAPGSTMILDGSDGYASNAGGDIGKLLNNAMGPGHRIVGPNEPRVMTFDVNGVHYEVVGNTIPLPPNAILTSGIPAPGFGGLPELRAPDLMPGGVAPDPNLPKAPDFVPDMNQLPPAPQDIVKSPTPSFFGEQPCIAPDGSQYFTPAGASC